MTQFTLINARKDLDKLVPVGTSLKAVNQKDNHDESAIRVYLEHDGSEVGYIGSKSRIPGTESNTVLYEEMKQVGELDGMELIVVDHQKQMVGNVKKVERILAVVEIKNKKGAVKNMSANAIQSESFELLVKGTTRTYKEKAVVVSNLLAGEETFVGLKMKGDKIVATFNNGLAGEVDSASQNFDLAVKVISTLGEVTATCDKPENSRYTVKFDIDEEQMTFIKTGKKVYTLQDVMDEKKAFVGMKRLKAIHKYLKDAGLTSKQIMKVMETYREYPDEVKGRIPEPSVMFKDEAGLVRKTVIYLSHGKHLRLEGEKGTGKNLLTTVLAWVYQRPLYELSMNSQTDKLDLLGSKTFVGETDSKGKEITKIGFQKEALVEAMEVGGFLNLDEINTADPSVLVLLHSIVDDRGSLEVPSYGRVQADKNFGILLTMNKGYIGTNSLNEATLDRFTTIMFPTNKSIAPLLKERVKGAKQQHITLADRVYSSIKNLVDAGAMTDDCLTVRGFIVALEVAEDIGLNEALVDNVANGIQDDDYRTTVKGFIDDIVAEGV